jgi:hypothetical protein
VPLRFSDNDGKEKLLLPHGRLTGAIKPSVGRLAWTTQSGNDHGSGIRGERFSEGHGQILPQKKKYAMQKINLANRPQCRHLARMTATTKIKKFRTKKAAESAVEECQAQGWKAGMRGNSESGWTVDAITTANGYRITYDLHTDGFFHEYSRKEVGL